MIHGTLDAYKRYKCRCNECSQANLAYQRYRHRQMAYGRWHPLVDAEPSRLRIKELMGAGIGLGRIAELSGTSTSTLCTIIYGRPSCGRGPTQRVRTETEAAILALHPRPEHHHPRSIVDATGTRRRLQALCALGWNLKELARRLGMHRETVKRWMDAKGLWGQHADAVKRLYDELWDACPPESTTVERGIARRARAAAARHGWAPPMAWDDGAIDDPAAEPTGAGYVPPAMGKLPDPDEIAHLVAGGDSLDVIAARYDVHPKAVQAKLTRAKKETS